MNQDLSDFASFFSKNGNEFPTGIKETSDDYLVVLEEFLAETKASLTFESSESDL